MSLKGDSSDDYLGLDVSRSLSLSFRKISFELESDKKNDLIEASRETKGGNVM